MLHFFHSPFTRFINFLVIEKFDPTKYSSSYRIIDSQKLMFRLILKNEDLVINSKTKNTRTQIFLQTMITI